ncbi:MAG: hypothetical protein Q8M55_08365 [Actinomycetota bacterium]|nr:hypothetical protein [Actinomycetota bacterium]
MRRTLTLLLAFVLLVVLALPLAGCQRKVTVLTGEIVLCTAGEVIEDNTEEVQVPAGDVEQYGVTTRVITCDEHGDLASVYASAQKAIADGDLVTARERLRTIVATDPSYRKAAEQLAEIDAGSRPAVDSGSADAGTDGTGGTGGTDGTGGEEPTQPDETPVGPVVSLTRYVPDKIDGYVAQGIIADLAFLSRQYLPTAKTADQLVIEVEQHVNADAAVAHQASFVEGYPDSATSKTINGKTVMAGVNGQYAVGIFFDGPLTVAVELHATGSSGAAALDAVFAVVQSITK